MSTDPTIQQVSQNRAPSHPAKPHETDSTVQTVEHMRSSYIQLQALVTIVLSYQLLFSADTLISQDLKLGAILALLSSCGLLMVLPARFMHADWFPGLVALGDTLFTSALIYISGNAGSDLYLAQ